jgi:YfiH family protein
MSLIERRFGCVLVLVPPDVEGVVFTTRVGGVSAAPFASLNLGYSTGDAPDAVAANRRALSCALGIDTRWAMARQVHGGRVVEATCDDRRRPLPREADGLVTRDAHLPVVMLAADCVPVALVGPAASGVVHAGWRGLAAGAIASGVAAVRADGAAVRAWIGPCIGPCHYEVGPEVSEQVARAAPHAPAFTTTVGGTTRFDLRAAARWMLEDAGATVAEADDPPCTWCDDRFFSHRRDRGTTGRQAVVVWRDAALG